MSTIIHYYIPEDREEQDKPNAFIIYKDQESIKLKDIHENFPVPGNYYFRFKYKHQNKNIWLDVNNENAKLPNFEDKIFMKVTRVNWNEHESMLSNCREKESFPDLI